MNRDDLKIMGILNITPDSFSDGGKYSDIDKALFHVEQMKRDGADIIDVGGESSRPGSDGISLTEEIDRVVPVIKRIKSEFDILVSIDTTKSELARIAVSDCNADIINDISALNKEENMASTVAELNVPLILMHMKGIPKNMQNKPIYNDVISEINEFFTQRIQFSVDSGIDIKNLILDPGIGFGKRLEDNVRIIKELSKFKDHELPILIGLSRKRFLGEISGEENPADRETETAIANLISIKNGASIIRVHDIKTTIKMIKTYYSLT